MLRKMALVAGLLSIAAGPAQAQQVFDPGVPAPKVASDYYDGAEKTVFHVSVDRDEKGYMGILGNVNNYVNALAAIGTKTDAVIVMNGDGLGLLRKAKELEFEAAARLPGRVTELKGKGVRFLVCYNTLVGRKIAFNSLYDAAEEDIIPSGVAEVGRLQAMGYRMIKP